MATRFIILRAMVALLCIGFAFLWGRAVALKGRPMRRGTGSTSWAIRTLITGAALQWGVRDMYSFLAYALAALSWGAGFYHGKRRKEPEEDLTKEMFPDD